MNIQAMNIADAPLTDQPWCDRCGGPVDTLAHDACRLARTLEPPRFCPQCRRRLKVQVLPAGWHASCVEHGVSLAPTSRASTVDP